LIRRKTQDPDYWQDEFAISSDDLQYLSGLLIEDELPRSAEELGRALVLHRYQVEEELVQRALSVGIPYQPKSSYEIEGEVVFPAMDYVVGKVVRIREGENPEYGDFRVIEVAFEDGRHKEFASELLTDHPLNFDVTAQATDGDLLRSAAELADEYGALVARLLVNELESDRDFVRLADKWFRRDLLVEVHVGHLNLAEAVLDMAGGGPLPTEKLIDPVDLPQEVNRALRVFSLNYALQEDVRFDEVGPAGEVLWFLSLLEPVNVRFVPRYLQPNLVPYDPELLTAEMRELQRDLDDEWSDVDVDSENDGPVVVTLTYPHWRGGTLPFSSRISRFFSTGRTKRIRFTFIDGETGTEMPGWIVREARYVCGLGEWYRANDVPIGGYLELQPGPNPGSVVVRRRGRRSRREWLRRASVVGGRLRFEMQRTQVTGDYDEHIVLALENQDTVDQLSLEIEENQIPLSRLVRDVFPELAKLSPQGSVHASTLYSVINTLTRVPPGPVLAELVSGGRYEPVGDNYWVLSSIPSGD